MKYVSNSNFMYEKLKGKLLVVNENLIYAGPSFGTM